MANVFLQLPAPAGSNGPGASVDVSAMGAAKTVAVGSSGGVYEPVITIEASMSGLVWAPLVTFQGRAEKQVSVASRFLRQNVAGFRDGVHPSVGVGADDAGATFTAVNVPAGNGAGVAVATGSLGEFKTVQVEGAFGGTLVVGISEDGGASFSPVMSFSAPGIQSLTFAADHIQISRSGVPTVNPGLPVVTIGDSTSSGGGGSGGNAQVFRYTAVLADTASPNIVIDAAKGFVPRANNGYNVQVTQGEAAQTVKTFNVPPSLFLTTQFTLILGAPPDVGDSWMFTVEDLS